MVKTQTRSTEARPQKAWHERGCIHIRFTDGAEMQFPTSLTDRLSTANEAALSEIEVLPYTLHPALAAIG
jgi:hypothetical protein